MNFQPGKSSNAVKSRDHMPVPTVGLSAADVIAIPRPVSLLARCVAAFGRQVDRLVAAIECWHMGRTLANGEHHIKVLEQSLEKTKAEVDDLRIKLILAEKRRDT